MTSLEEARELLAEYRATPPASTRRRVRLALQMIDVAEEFRERLLSGAPKIVGAVIGDRINEQAKKQAEHWVRMNGLRLDLRTELDALGMDKHRLTVAFAETIFQADRVND